MNPKQMANALTVIVKDPKISAWLQENDPKAWKQCCEALGIGPAPAKKMNRIEAARQIREEAAKWHAAGDEEWAKSEGISSACHADAADLMTVAKLVEEGSLKKASYKADHLDTIVRESIPEPVWIFLQENS